ncbi:hypothetical protein Tco_1046070, partial [Tanacetum coccineum]
MQSVCGLEFALGNRFTYARAFTNAVLDLFPRYEQINSHGIILCTKTKHAKPRIATPTIVANRKSESEIDK